MAEETLREVAPGVHVAEAKQRFVGLEVGARMTVLETSEGLLVHSPLATDAVSPDAVAALGAPRWALAPNLLHHLYVGPWSEAGVETWAAPGLVAKRADVRFAGEVASDAQPFGPDIEVMPLSCIPMTHEVVVLHRPSKTLVVCDLVFNIGPTAPWMTRAMMRCIGGYPGCRVTLLERMNIRREAAKRELSAIAAWDFDRLIMSHGDIIETGAKEAFQGAFAWVLGRG